MAAATLYKRYLWLVDLIYNAKTITREDIDHVADNLLLFKDN